jgi:3-hydroxyacyl-[acyl-carrier-protein] dehydratase
MQKKSLSHAEIRKLLPHRYPFLLVDQVTEIVPGEKGTGIKNITGNEPFFTGHFPEEPVVPGVLIVEACGQLAGLVRMNQQDNLPLEKPKIEYLASIQKFNFKQKVYPGDQLILQAFNFIKVGQLLQVNVRALVKTTLVAEGVLILTAVNEN